MAGKRQWQSGYSHVRSVVSQPNLHLQGRPDCGFAEGEVGAGELGKRTKKWA